MHVGLGIFFGGRCSVQVVGAPPGWEVRSVGVSSVGRAAAFDLLWGACRSSWGCSGLAACLQSCSSVQCPAPRTPQLLCLAWAGWPHLLGAAVISVWRSRQAFCLATAAPAGVLLSAQGWAPHPPLDAPVPTPSKTHPGHRLSPASAAMNWVGSMVAMLGTYLYSVAKQRASEEAKAAKAAAPKAA